MFITNYIVIVCIDVDVVQLAEPWAQSRCSL